MEQSNLYIPQIKPEEKPVYMQVSNEASKEVLEENNQKPNKKARIVAIFLLLFFLLQGLCVLNFVFKARGVLAGAKELKNSLAAKDFNKLKEGLKNLDSSVGSLKKAYRLFSWSKYVPFLGKYVSDAGHFINAGQEGLKVAEMVAEIATPYADLIGFDGGNTAADGQATARDRIDFVVKTIPQVLPKLGDIESKLDVIDKELAQVEPARYPVKFRGKAVRAGLESGLSSLKQITALVRNGKPLLEKTPYLLGLDSVRTYLVLFQNDKELRPTGGFMTAYSIMKVDKAKFEPVESDDIYNLDSKYKPGLPAPEPIIDYIRGPYILNKNWRLRDMNWSPDFSEAMNLFTREIESVGIKNIDGVIAVDTQLLVNLLEVIGPIGVPGFGNYSNGIVKECNCQQVIYELESFADTEGPVVWDPAGTGKIIYAPANYDNRKKIIGPLMNSILANAFAQPKAKLPQLIEAAYKSVLEKHVLLYLYDKETQTAAEGFGIAGRVADYAGDYLQINDSNLGGRKSNLYVTQEVVQEISVGKDGSVEKTVTITYKNPEKQDGWLNSVLPNWLRVYVPKGSQLISFEGVEDRVDPYEDLGKTVFAGYFELRPQGVVKASLKYKLPFKADKQYNLLIQKQPGTSTPLYQLKLGKKTEEFFLKTDKEISFRL